MQQIGTDIWLVEGGMVDFHGFPYPVRSVIVRLQEGSLWVWSPVKLTENLQAEVDALGSVGHLVSPNKIHHLFLSDWLAAYPNAALWGLQSTIDKRRDLSFRGALGDQAPGAWEGEIEQFWFRGSFFMDEVAFFHRPSRTAVLADLSENFSDNFLRQHWGGWKTRFAKLWKITEGYGYAPLEWRWSFWNRKPARTARDRLLACNPVQVVMAHGEWQSQNGREYLEKSLAWLGK